jgi:hypothetical protein
LTSSIKVHEEHHKRVGTGQLNSFLEEALLFTPPDPQRGRALKVYYATQVKTAPPTFAFFVNDEELMHFSYLRHLENKMREAFGFDRDSHQDAGQNEKREGGEMSFPGSKFCLTSSVPCPLGTCWASWGKALMSESTAAATWGAPTSCGPGPPAGSPGIDAGYGQGLAGRIPGLWLTGSPTVAMLCGLFRCHRAQLAPLVRFAGRTGHCHQPGGDAGLQPHSFWRFTPNRHHYYHHNPLCLPGFGYRAALFPPPFGSFEMPPLETGPG